VCVDVVQDVILHYFMSATMLIDLRRSTTRHELKGE
jgi:hypothetical protein